MRQRIRAIRQSDSGFTLIELLIVIVILGILAGVVVFAVNGITDRGTLAACKADKKTVETAIEAYYAKNTAYPLSIDDSTPTTPATATSLVGAGLLREKPSNSGYNIVYTSADGKVTVTGLAGC